MKKFKFPGMKFIAVLLLLLPWITGSICSADEVEFNSGERIRCKVISVNEAELSLTLLSGQTRTVKRSEVKSILFSPVEIKIEPKEILFNDQTKVKELYNVSFSYGRNAQNLFFSRVKGSNDNWLVFIYDPSKDYQANYRLRAHDGQPVFHQMDEAYSKLIWQAPGHSNIWYEKIRHGHYQFSYQISSNVFRPYSIIREPFEIIKPVFGYPIDITSQNCMTITTDGRFRIFDLELVSDRHLSYKQLYTSEPVYDSSAHFGLGDWDNNYKFDIALPLKSKNIVQIVEWDDEIGDFTEKWHSPEPDSSLSLMGSLFIDIDNNGELNLVLFYHHPASGQMNLIVYTLDK